MNNLNYTKNYKGLKGRDILINELVEEYLRDTAAKLTYIQAEDGQGKTYVITKLIDNISSIQKTTDIDIIKNVGDELIRITGMGKERHPNSISVSGGVLGFSIGFGIGWENSESLYYKVYSMVCKSSRKKILLCIDDFSDCTDNLRFLISFIIKNISKLASETKKKIYVFLTDTLPCSVTLSTVTDMTSVKNISLPIYEIEDVSDYLQNHVLLDYSEKIHDIFRLSGGNLKLVGILYEDMLLMEKTYTESLSKVIERKLYLLKKKGSSRNISNSDIEDILFSGSLSEKRFTPFFLQNIIQKDISLFEMGLEIVKSEQIIDKDFFKHYFFLSKDIKRYIADLASHERDILLLLYYNYYAQYNQSEYFLRGYYLYRYFNKVNNTVAALFMIAYSIARKSNDNIKTDKIKGIIFGKDTDSEIQNVFSHIEKIYDDLENSNVDIIIKDYKAIHTIFIDVCVKAMITVDIFHYLYVNTPMASPECINILNNCFSYAVNELNIDISQFDGIIHIDETILRLKIIYEIAPCILDQRNDYEKFNELYIISKDIQKNNSDQCRKGYAEYIQNVFNRKAFLYVNQAACGIYYDKAKYYFRKNDNWLEYYITLVCEAGTFIVIQEYEKAIENCIEVEKGCLEKHILLPQIEKLYNNKIIAEFLLVEKNNNSKTKILSAARKSLKELKLLLNGQKNASQYVIYTNICSLCLYCDRETTYLNYKKKLEKLYGCDDISNILNEDIDDFYRYYFSWFELYRTIHNQDWQLASKIIKNIDGFVPALFKKQEIFWKNKNDATIKLINSRTAINSYDFCNNLVKTKRKEQILSKFFYRGLMLSDLQYTSYF